MRPVAFPFRLAVIVLVAFALAFAIALTGFAVGRQGRRRDGESRDTKRNYQAPLDGMHARDLLFGLRSVSSGLCH
jgi:hypothetical protein